MESLDAIQPTDAGDFGWSEVAIEPTVVTLGIRSEGDFKAITNPPKPVTLAEARRCHSN